MTQARIEINSVPGSNDNLPINTLVQLSNDDNGGELTYLWSILDQPPGLVDSLSAANIENPTFTPKKEGTYLLQLIANFGLPDEQRNKVVAAVKQFKTLERIPAAGETIEADTADGWATAMNSLLRRIDSLLTDPGIIVGENASGGILSRGVVVRVTSGAVIKSGLPGQETVPGFTTCPASILANVDELLCVIESDVAGSFSVAAGALMKVRYIGRLAALGIGSGAVGDPVFVSDTATLSTTPGTYRRQVGSIMAVSGGNRDVWFDGVGGADITPIDRAYVLYGAPASGMLNSHRIDGNNATPGATGGVPYLFKAGDIGTFALVARRFSAGASAIFATQDESGNDLVAFGADGDTDFMSHDLYRAVLRSINDSFPSLWVKRRVFQTSDLASWQDEFGNPLLKITPAGMPTLIATNFDANSKKVVNLANPTNPQDATSKTYVDQNDPQVGNFLINGGFDFYQRRNSILAWSYDNLRAYRFDRWTTYTSIAGESGIVTVLPSYPSQAVYQGSSAMVLTRTAGGVAGSTTFITQEIDRFLGASMRGQSHRLSVVVGWSALTSPASLTIRLITGTGIFTEVASPAYPSGSVTEATATFPLGVGGSSGQKFTLPIPTPIGNNVRCACVQILITPNTTVAETYTIGAAMLRTSSGACDVDVPFRRQSSSIAGELLACQQFFETSYRPQDLVGTITANGQLSTYIVNSVAVANLGGLWHLATHPKFLTRKNSYAAPVVTLYNPSTGAPGSWLYLTAGNVATGASNISSNGFDAINAIGGGGSTVLAVQRVFGHWTVAAEL